MDKKDQDLKDLLAGLKSFETTKNELKDWQNAVQAAVSQNQKRSQTLLQAWQWKRWQGAPVAAALILGIIIGKMDFSRWGSGSPSVSPKETAFQENYIELDATLQYSYVKSSKDASSQKDL